MHHALRTTVPVAQTSRGGERQVGYLVLVPEGTDPAQLPGHAVPAALVPAPQGRTAQPAQPTRDDALRIDRARHTVHVDGTELSLTYLEFELLAHLVAHPHRVHTREQLVAGVWGYGDHVGDGRTVDVHIARLRRKLGPAHRHRIVTIRRVGYKYEPQPAT